MRRWLWFFILVLLLATVACQKSSSGDYQASGGLDESAPEVDAEGSGAGDGGVVVAGIDLPGISAKLVKTADLELEVPREGFSDALREAMAIAGRFGGFVLTTAVEGRDARRGSIAVRVPSERFEAALAELHGLGEVEAESVSTEDVGQEFVDMEARLRNLRAQEAVLLRLYERAETIPETIRVQSEVSGVQLQIEELEGRLRYLRDQTSLGTISVSLTEAGAVPARLGPIGRAWRTAVEVTTGIASGLIVGLGALLPVALLGLIAWPLVRRVRRSATSP